MKQSVDHHVATPDTCASWVPDHMRGSTPTLQEYMKRLETQRQEDRDGRMADFIFNALVFGGSIVATGLAVGALAVSKVDKTFHLGIGAKLEHISPDPHDDGIKHDIQQALHDFGHDVVEDEK